MNKKNVRFTLMVKRGCPKKAFTPNLISFDNEVKYEADRY